MRIHGALAAFLIVLTTIPGNLAARLRSAAAFDGAWQSARYYGGTDYEFGARLVVDGAGNSYFLGYTFSADMAPSIVPVSRASGEPASATFVLKVNPEGTRVYATAVGTGISVRPIDLDVGADGTAHVLVRDGDVTRVIKLDALGRETMHVVIDPHAGPEVYPRAIASDDAGNSVVAGWSAEGLFVARLDDRGGVLGVYRIRGSADVRDVTVDAAGNIYLIGIAFAGDLPTTAGALRPQFMAGACPVAGPPDGRLPRTTPCTDAFVMKMTRAGALAYATYFGGSGWDDGQTIAVDRAGFAIISGATESSDLPLVAAAKPQCNAGVFLPCGDAYIAKLDPNGAALVFSTYVGIQPVSLAADVTGTVYAAGAAGPSRLPTYRAPQPDFGGGEADGFVIAYSPMGQIQWSTYIGGSGEDALLGVGGAAGIVYFGGVTTSPDLASGGEPFHGGRDLFLAAIRNP